MTFPRRGPRLWLISRATRQGRRCSRACRPSLSWERCDDRLLLSISLVSVDSTGTASGNAGSDFQNPDGSLPDYAPSQSIQANLSADGTELVFASEASNLVPSSGDTNQASNVFVRNTQTGVTSLVSVTPQGDSGNGPSFDPAISPNGEYVAFESQSTNLTDESGLTAGTSQSQAVGYLYVRNLQTGTTTLLEQTPSGQVGDGWSTGQFVFSPNSQYLAWVDTSDNLTGAPLDPNSSSNSGGGWDSGPGQAPNYIYIRNLAAQTTSLVSESTAGDASGDLPENDPGPIDLVFSPDSQALVFGSSATDLTANLPDNSTSTAPATAPYNLFLRDLATGTTSLLSVTAGGQLPSGISMGAVFSPNSQDVAFESTATDLTANAADPTQSPALAESGEPASNIYVRDLSTDTTSLVTATPGGLLSNGTASEPVFSPDGSALAYTSSASDLTTNPLDPALPPGSAASGYSGPSNVFLTNLSTGVTTLESATPSGMMSSGDVGQIVFSPDGNLLAFTSDAGDLTSNPLDSTPPVIPGTSTGNASGGQSGIENVFVRNLTTQTTTLESATTSGQLSNANAYGVFFSPDSQSLFFVSSAVDLTSNPPDASASPGGISNLFVRDLPAGTTTLISGTTSGQLSESTYTNALLSPDGQTVYFDSSVDDLTTGDANQSTDIFAATAPFTAPDQFQFASWNVAASESAGQAVVTVLRSGPATAAASVNYTVEDGSAHAGTDFKATVGTLTFAAGQTSAKFTVPLLASDHFDGTRSADLVLSDPQGASLGYPSAFLSLTSTPAPPSPAPVVPKPAAPSPAPVVPKAASPTPVTPEPGPAVTGVATLQGRRGDSSLVVTFNQPLDPESAETVANYQLTVPGRAVHTHAGHSNATRPGRSLAIKTAAYNAATHQVTLTLRTRLRRGETYQFQINGVSGGVKGTTGTALNSSGTLEPGKDYQVVLDLAALRS